MANQPDPRPVFEADQVLTYLDITLIRNGYMYLYQQTPWYNIPKRFMYKTAYQVCQEQLHWLVHQKPVGGVNCQGGHSEKV